MERKGNMRDRFDIDQVIKITGLGIRAEQADGGADFDVACQIAVKKLWEIKEYESLEEQNKLLKLPCAVGDTVYRVRKGTKLSPDRTYECRVVGIKQEYNTFSVKLYANINEETYSIWIDDWFDCCQIGYEFFLTREEAEVTLKELSE